MKKFSWTVLWIVMAILLIFAITAGFAPLLWGEEGGPVLTEHVFVKSISGSGNDVSYVEAEDAYFDIGSTVGFYLEYENFEARNGNRFLVWSAVIQNQAGEAVTQSSFEDSGPVTVGKRYWLYIRIDLWMMDLSPDIYTLWLLGYDEYGGRFSDDYSFTFFYGVKPIRA